MKPGSVLDYSGSSNMAILAWIIGGLLTLASGLTVAEIGAQIENGGLYTYLDMEFWGYLSGWMQTIVYGYWNVRVIL